MASPDAGINREGQGEKREECSQVFTTRDLGRWYS